MKIFAFTDLHGDLEALRKIHNKIEKEKPELILCAGDLSIFEDHFSLLVSELDSFGLPVLLIHGNHESESLVRNAARMFSNIKDLHKKTYKKSDTLFLGYGGGGFSLVDEGFVKISKKFKDEIRKHKPKKIVLMTHAPPYNTKVDQIHGNCAGNKSIRDFIEKVKPDIVICGHLHENEGKQDKIGSSRIINPGYEGKTLTF
ncbi:metallophosphoesterase [Candidatus Woesearchaeota archaeon]|nr:metallophosphoesterase [Candidatus Woesearchaeota archaeon]